MTVSNLETANLIEQESETPLDQRKSVYQTTITEDQRLADAILTAVATVSRDEETLPPLSDEIDLHRLKTLVNSLRTTKSGAVQFLYASYHVELRWSGELKLWPQSSQ